MKEKGQSLVEVVFAIGLILLVITGITMLLVNTIGSRTKSYERIRAVELSQVVMETLVSKEIYEPTDFWNMDSLFWRERLGLSLTDPNFVNYDYQITVTPETNDGCTAITCVNVVVSVGWSGSPNGVRDNFNRFFSRQ